MIDRGCFNHALDMAQCSGLDSTFMGVLAGVALRLSRLETGRMIMLNVSSKISNLVETLGLSYLITPYAPGTVPEGADLESVLKADLAELDTPTSEDKRATTLIMLDAHEDLIEAAPANLPKFKDVLAYLRDDLHERESPS